MTAFTLTAPRVPALDEITSSKRIYLHFYDPYGERFGLPTYPWRWAPSGLLTVRQLRERGLRPGGQSPAAQILWRDGKRVAYLYFTALALPKRTATERQLAAIQRALRARRTCASCGREQDYCISLRLGECNDCADGETSRRLDGAA
jgi:hypothetical protein